MAVYKVTFTPSGPYFFGNEKNFSFNGSAYGSQYFIRSEVTPSQSTILGALRYILLPEKGFDKVGSFPKDIGEKSFSLDSGEVQQFGKIKGLSAIFLSKGDEHFIPTPFDHNLKSERKEADPQNPEKKIGFYTPFADYQPLGIDEGKVYTESYDAKEGIANSFVSLADGHLETELFGTDVRIGINRKNPENGFFKREYRTLRHGFAFAVYAEIDREMTQSPYTVQLGQGKVPFAVRFEQADGRSILTEAETFLQKYDRPYKTLICLSDMPACEGDLYANSCFAIVQTRDYRSYATKTGGGVTKGTTLHRLVKAGSIFLLKKDCGKLFDDEIRHQNAAVAGYHQFAIVGGNDK